MTIRDLRVSPRYVRAGNEQSDVQALACKIFHRFLVAGIAGAVVGFFSNFAINTGTSVSPLAVAFLARYAVDVFFPFLEGFMQAFMKDN
jgi:hypothetical protein